MLKFRDRRCLRNTLLVKVGQIPEDRNLEQTPYMHDHKHSYTHIYIYIYIYISDGPLSPLEKTKGPCGHTSALSELRYLGDKILLYTDRVSSCAVCLNAIATWRIGAHLGAYVRASRKRVL